jgi:hypothetical protein
MEGDPESSARRFWRGFLERERVLHASEPPPDGVMDEVLADLLAFCPDLGFEVSNLLQGGQKEIVITAHGVRDRFAAVAALVAAAPRLERWRVVGLKRGSGFSFTHERGSVRLEAATLRFDPLAERTEDGRLRIAVYVPGADAVPSDALVTGVHLVLMTGLGERIHTEDLGGFVVRPLTDETRETSLPIEDLRRYLEWDRRRHPLPGIGEVDTA